MIITLDQMESITLDIGYKIVIQKYKRGLMIMNAEEGISHELNIKKLTNPIRKKPEADVLNG